MRIGRGSAKITNFADNGNFEIKMGNGLIYSDMVLFCGGEGEKCGVWLNPPRCGLCLLVAMFRELWMNLGQS